MKKSIFALAVLLALSACKTTVQDTPDVSVSGNGYEVSVENGGSNGNFCPPGQAKKGNC